MSRLQHMLGIIQLLLQPRYRIAKGYGINQACRGDSRAKNSNPIQIGINFESTLPTLLSFLVLALPVISAQSAPTDSDKGFQANGINRLMDRAE